MSDCNSKIESGESTSAPHGSSQRDDRYQFQSPIVKAWRWVLYRPLFMFCACWQVLLWATTGARIPIEERDLFPTRWSFVKHIWTVNRSLASFRMRHWHTIDEVKHLFGDQHD